MHGHDDPMHGHDDPTSDRGGAHPITGPVDAAVTGRGPVSGRLDDSFNGHLLDRSHTVPPEDLATVVAEEFHAVGARDVAIWLQDYGQRLLHPLPLPGYQLPSVETIDGTIPGRAFALRTFVEHDEATGGRRLWVPLLNGTERVGVMALTFDHFDDELRGYVRRLAATIAHLVFSKGYYTDEFQRLRRRRNLSLAAEMQWALLPPLSITTPAVSVAGMLEPAYKVAGDSFDYALNQEGLHLAIIDAMGHGLPSAMIAHAAVSAYRHARRSQIALADMYEGIDAVMAEQFDEDTFATAQIATLDVGSGMLSWVNAGHPPPMLVRGRRVVRSLVGEPSMPIGFGGAAPVVTHEQLEPGDRLLFFTDGVVEHRDPHGEMFGEGRLGERLLRHLSEQLPGAEVVRRLNRDLLDVVGAQGPSDDATIVLLHWTGPDTAEPGEPSPHESSEEGR